jgi:iron complex outermembrane receptor protein
MGYFELLTDRVTNNIHISAYEPNFKTRQLHSDYYVEDASFLKLDNITLGYNFEKIQKFRLKAYVTAQNVFTLSGYSGVEPEIFSGVDNNLYPRSTTIVLGINASF